MTDSEARPAGEFEALEPVLRRLESWVEVRVVGAVAASGPAGATERAVAWQLLLSEREVAAILEAGARHGLLRRVEEGDAEPRFTIAGEVPLLAVSRLVAAADPRPQEQSLDPAPGAEGRDARQVASDVRRLYLRLFQESPNLPWLLKQRRRAMLLGEEFGALLATVQAARPRGNPQAYLEGMLKRLERERGAGRAP